ncbi:LOG family protein [Loigolactobacillus jiayinensis]|uniref:Cytokinin riboside 5'-monophosphate phosphoribohydrolase n=1 Tax=Loigolactobacillus jiayinensis TaxID=2486016 RepID=A0ABW1REU0_9LACO|nr:TIGR00730 family Rossman fold protein [Loigolactobacillus jiayinensis]
MKNITIFCGSNTGLDPKFQQQALALGQYMAQHQQALIYGGSDIGLMHDVSHSMTAAGGEVIGVIPQIFVDRGQANPHLTQLIQVADMSERKTKLIELADAFIVLPGGFGTFEELWQALSWSQLGLHHKPIAIFNIDGFFDPLVATLQQMIDSGFAPIANRDLLINATTIAEIYQGFANFHYQIANKYLN